MSMKELSAKLEASGLKVLLVVSRFNDFLTRQLLAGAVDCLARHGASEDDITVAWVPGANEIPLAMQRAVVATNQGGPPEILAHGGGVLVPPGDAEALAAAISGLLSDRDRRLATARIAREQAEERFDITSHVNAVVDLYDELLSSPGGSGGEQWTSPS